MTKKIYFALFSILFLILLVGTLSALPTLIWKAETNLFDTHYYSCNDNYSTSFLQNKLYPFTNTTGITTYPYLLRLREGYANYSGFGLEFNNSVRITYDEPPYNINNYLLQDIRTIKLESRNAGNYTYLPQTRKTLQFRYKINMSNQPNNTVLHFPFYQEGEYVPDTASPSFYTEALESFYNFNTSEVFKLNEWNDFRISIMTNSLGNGTYTLYTIVSINDYFIMAMYPHINFSHYYLPFVNFYFTYNGTIPTSVTGVIGYHRVIRNVEPYIFIGARQGIFGPDITGYYTSGFHIDDIIFSDGYPITTAIWGYYKNDSAFKFRKDATENYTAFPTPPVYKGNIGTLTKNANETLSFDLGNFYLQETYNNLTLQYYDNTLNSTIKISKYAGTGETCSPEGDIKVCISYVNSLGFLTFYGQKKATNKTITMYADDDFWKETQPEYRQNQTFNMNFIKLVECYDDDCCPEGYSCENYECEKILTGIGGFFSESFQGSIYIFKNLFPSYDSITLGQRTIFVVLTMLITTILIFVITTTTKGAINPISLVFVGIANLLLFIYFIGIRYISIGLLILLSLLALGFFVLKKIGGKT